MFCIVAHYYFTPGTPYAPKSGPMDNDNGCRLIFDSREAAYDHLAAYLGGNVCGFIAKNARGYGSQRYCRDGAFVLRPGERERPDYEIKRMPPTKRQREATNA